MENYLSEEINVNEENDFEVEEDYENDNDNNYYARNFEDDYESINY